MVDQEPPEESARGRQRPAEPVSEPVSGPVLPDRPRDETGVGWGDEPAERDEEWYRRERPPHHE